MSDKGITLEGLAAAVDALRQELATWKALARKQDALSADQITATQSGATAAKISQIAVNTAAIQSLAAQVAGQISLEYVTTLPATGEPLTLYLVPQGDGTAPNFCNEYLWINDAWELIGTTGAMASNGELTIQVNGVAVGTFTANQAANSTVNIAVPTNTNQLTNGAQFVDAAALQAALALKQNSLNASQLEAVNSGITAAAVQQIADNATAIAGKQDALTTAQQAAVDSGATAAKIDQIASNASAIVSLTSSKQDALSTTQLAAVNSGVTAAAVQQIGTNASNISGLQTAVASKAADDQVVHLAGAETITGDKTFTGAVVTHNITPETDNSYSLGTSGLKWADIQSAGMTCWGTYVYQTGITAAAQGTQSTAINYSVLSAITTDATANFFCRQQISISSALTQYALYLRMYDSNGDLTADNAVIYRLTSSGLNIFPRTSGTADLGTSTNNWKSVYAQSYYYGGTEFQNKFVTADTTQTITGNKTFSGAVLNDGFYEKTQKTAIDVRTNPSTAQSSDTFKIWSGALSNRGDYLGGMSFAQLADGSLRFQWICFGYPVSGNPYQHRVNLRSYRDGNCAFYPETNNDINLGLSSAKWKSLNGINPGALCLPNFGAAITLDTTNWDKTGEWGANANFWTPTVNGWLTVLVNGAPGSGWVQLSQADSLGQFSICLSTGYAWATIPVVANASCKICLLCSTVSAKFYPCLGNV